MKVYLILSLIISLTCLTSISFILIVDPFNLPDYDETLYVIYSRKNPNNEGFAYDVVYSVFNESCSCAIEHTILVDFGIKTKLEFNTWYRITGKIKDTIIIEGEYVLS